MVGPGFLNCFDFVYSVRAFVSSCSCMLAAGWSPNLSLALLVAVGLEKFAPLAWIVFGCEM